MLPDHLQHENEQLPDQQLRIIREREEHLKNRSYAQPVDVSTLPVNPDTATDSRSRNPAEAVKRVKE